MKNNRKKGFTLVELIVVIAIIVILAGVLVVSLTGWIQRARDSRMLTECRACVVAAQTLSSERAATGDTLESGTPPEDSADIQALAEVTGSVTSLDVDDNRTVTYLSYERDGSIMIYDAGSYYNAKDAATKGSGAPNYKRISTSLVSGLEDGGKKNLWTKLRDAFKEANGGSYPALTGVEQSYLQSQEGKTPISQGLTESLTWKPALITANATSASQKDDVTGVLMVATAGDSNMAYMVYYNGDYYYHTNGSNKMDNAFVSEQGLFDVNQLTTNPQWVKIS